MPGIQAFALTRRNRQIATYLGSNQQRYLRLGSSSYTDPGWLSVDLIPLPPSVVYMDATKRFPLPSQSFDAIQCEHVIEHLAYAHGTGMLAECHRVLRPGGILRIATPDLDLVRRLLDPDDADPVLTAYVNWSNQTLGTPAERDQVDNVAFTVNRLVRDWGHVFIYDEQTLRGAMAAAGFSEIVKVAPGDSAHAALRGIDRHQDEIGEASNKLETLALEATA